MSYAHPSLENKRRAVEVLAAVFGGGSVEEDIQVPDNEHRGIDDYQKQSKVYLGYNGYECFPITELCINHKGNFSKNTCYK